MVRNKAKMILDAEAYLYQFLQPIQRTLFIKYEDLYTPEGYSDSFMKFLNGRFRLSLPNTISGNIRKNRGDKRDIIENYDAVVQTVKEQIDKAGGRVF